MPTAIIEYTSNNRHAVAYAPTVDIRKMIGISTLCLTLRT